MKPTPQAQCRNRAAASAGHRRGVRWRCRRCSGYAAASTSAKDEAERPRRRSAGSFTSRLPITGQTFERTRRMVRRAMEKAKKDNARLVLVFEFDVPKGQKDFGRGSDFGAAHDLANFLSSDELNAVRTVAYLPNSIEGHAVLPAIACQEIIMAKDATIGAAGIDEKTLTPTLRSAYAEIAGRRRTVPVGGRPGNARSGPRGLAGRDRSGSASTSRRRAWRS